MEVSQMQRNVQLQSMHEPAASRRKCRKGKTKCDPTLQPQPLKSNVDDGNKNPKIKLKKNDVNDNACKGGTDGSRISKQVLKKEGKICSRGHGGRLIKITANIEIPVHTPKCTEREDNEIVVLDDFCIDKAVQNQEKGSDVETLLPQSIELKDIASTDIPGQDVGHALQFLEFCEAFRQVLDLRKGEPECLLQELACGRSERRKLHSAIVQFHIQLLSMILKDLGEEYVYSFYTSTKLRILVFLCDEALGAVNLRKWIGEQNSKFVERQKAEKEKLLVKEKNMKQKLQDEFNRAMLARNGAPLSISGHEDFVSKVKEEVAQSLAETLDATYIGAKRKHWSGAVRSEPILSDGKGHIFWSLTTYSGKMDVLLQDLRNWKLFTLNDRWFTYDVEQNSAVEKYLSSMRG